MAEGRVIIGYSYPYYALYSNTGSTITYSDGNDLARGVGVDFKLDTADSTNWYANNVMAESAQVAFTGGQVTLTCDGMHDEVRKAVAGLPAPSTETVGSSSVKFYDYDDRQSVPFLGIGFVIKYMENGVESFVPYVFPKVKLTPESYAATTQGESVDFQTNEYVFDIFRDDSANHRWQRIGEAQASEVEAYNAVKAVLGAK